MTTPTILWFRRDLRLSDHDALRAAIARGGPVIPVFIETPDIADLGAAARWRLGRAVETLSTTLDRQGVTLVMRKGAPAQVLDRLIAETGAGAVFWSRRYDPAGMETDRAIKADLEGRGLVARSFRGFLLFEPWQVATKQGQMFRVYSPFWRAVREMPVDPISPAPGAWPKPDVWPASDAVDLAGFGREMKRGADVVARYCRPGEGAALQKLGQFEQEKLGRYKQDRDFPGHDATSGMSEYLTYGEVSPRRLWQAGLRAMTKGQQGAEHFLKEIVWREFAWHLYYHTPHIAERNWRSEWDRFDWRPDNSDAEAWRRGRTGEPFVDAAMREMYVTGRMHNRARMIAASYLTKHLLTDWRVGQACFADCLTDWDPASNAMGWQWVAGSGPDAAPYFRIFNPAVQAEKFDSDGRYRRRWIAEGQTYPDPDALAYFDAIPKSWNMSPDRAYGPPIIDLAEGRARALSALARSKASQ